MYKKVKKEINRLHKKFFRSDVKDRQIESLQSALVNQPYELFDRRVDRQTDYSIPDIRTIDETLDKIVRDRCSISRFGDGEFNVLNGGRIHFQERSSEISKRLKEVIASEDTRLLIALVDTFGNLDTHTPPGIDFWRKWMSRKRERVYSHLNKDRIYYNALFTRPYMIFNKSEAHYTWCTGYFHKVRQLWAGRHVVICEGEGTRFGMFNDLLTGAASVRRILCPARNAFDRYDRILAACEPIDRHALVLAALGPTATVLAHDLCVRGIQTIDIGHLDLEYEWFLKKETEGRPVAFKYVDGSAEGRKVYKLDDSEYAGQIISKIL